MPLRSPPPIKTPTRSNTRNRGGTYFTVIPPTLLPITSTSGSITAAAASIEYIGVYLAIAISIYINIVRKRVANIAKDIRAIDRRLKEFKDSLSNIKDKLAFLRRSIIILIYNTRLPDIK